MLDCRAYTEVNVIINSLSTFERNKIPQKIRDNIKQRMDKNYKFTIDVNNIKHTTLLNDSKKILSVLYSDYLSTDEEREVITKVEQNIYRENEKIKAEKFPVDVFGNKNKNIVDYQEKALIEVPNKKISIFSKIKQIIIKIFKN